VTASTEPPFTVDDLGSLHLGPRVVPVPKSVSAQAQAFLAAAPRMPRADPPELDDLDGWRRFAREADNNPMIAATEEMIQAVDAVVETQLLGGATVHVASPNKKTSQTHARIYVYIHGGSLISGGGNITRLSAARLAVLYDCICYGVDYRMPPDHPYPASLDDCVNAYRAILSKHADASPIVGGASAGGNLAAAVALRIRDEDGTSLRALVLLSPELDLTESGDTFETNRYVDVVLLTGVPVHNALYANGHDLADPYLSPLFGDFSKGFPPTFIQSGTRDLFLSNAARLQRALRNADVPVDLQLWEAMPHGLIGLGPEMEEVRSEVQQFLDRHWN
jgi:acetyl esterase/lipase